MTKRLLAVTVLVLAWGCVGGNSPTEPPIYYCPEVVADTLYFQGDAKLKSCVPFRRTTSR